MYLYFPRHNIYRDVLDGRHYVYARGKRRSYGMNPIKAPLGPSFFLEMSTDKPYQQNNAHLALFRHAMVESR
ncbi:MAG: hypothetical protein ACOCWR_01050, partial [Oceanidesulfovibrio sp.]